MTKLLPCPFCGSSEVDPRGWASLEQYLGSDLYRSGPACDGCGASAPSIEDWNRRQDAPKSAYEAAQR